MLAWCRDLLWQLEGWDSALSRRAAFAQESAVGRPRLWSVVVRFVAHLGDSWLWLAICGLMLTIAQRGAQTHRGKRLTAALSLLAVMVATAAVVATVKQLVKRKRPRTASFLYGAGVDVHSFPSGHAARLAAIAIWLGGVFPGWGRQLWLLAFLVGFSRVHLGIHYIGDVIAGFAVGGFTGWLLRQVWRNKTANR